MRSCFSELKRAKLRTKAGHAEIPAYRDKLIGQDVARAMKLHEIDLKNVNQAGFDRS